MIMDRETVKEAAIIVEKIEKLERISKKMLIDLGTFENDDFYDATLRLKLGPAEFAGAVNITGDLIDTELIYRNIIEDIRIRIIMLETKLKDF